MIILYYIILHYIILYIYICTSSQVLYNMQWNILDISYVLYV